MGIDYLQYFGYVYELFLNPDHEINLNSGGRKYEQWRVPAWRSRAQGLGLAQLMTSQ